MQRYTIKKIFTLMLSMVILTTLLISGFPAVLAVEPSGIDPAEFVDPDFQYRPGVRWWWPGNAAETEDLLDQVDYLADNGFGVVEIVAFTNGFLPEINREASATNANIAHATEGYDEAAILSYDTPDYYAKLKAVVARCNERGIVVDLNMGSGYLASDDSVTLEDSQAHMALGRRTITATDTSPISGIDVPAVEPGVFYGMKIQGSRAGDWDASAAHLCAVVIAPITNKNAGNLNGRNQVLDFSDPAAPTIAKTYTTQYQLNFADAICYEGSEIVGGQIAFVPPVAGEYEVIALYSIPTGSVALNAIRENAAGKRAYVVDHLDADAAKHFVEGWLGDPGLAEIVENYDIRGAFNDSYEFWMDRYFNDRIYELAKEEAGPDGLLGYDITPFIPSFYQQLANAFTMSASGGLGPYYSSLTGLSTSGGTTYFSNSLGSAVHNRILYDYNQLINKAFLEGMEAFSDTFAQYDADGTGIKYRQQAYNPPIDTLKSSKYVDIPETEGETENSLRRVASGAHLYGKNLVTNEVFTLGNVPFNVLPQKIKLGYDTMAVSGVNNFFYHGLDAPYYGSGTEMEDGLFPEEGWRGWTTIGVEMADTEALSPYYKTMNDYAARANYVMQSGKPSSDVAVYMPLFGGALSSNHSAITTLNRNGLTWDAINNDCIVEELTWNAGGNGKLETAAGTTYDALLIYQQTIPVSAMEALLALAEAGAPIIFYGGLPNAQPSYAGGDYLTQDALVSTLAGQVLTEDSVTHIATVAANNANSADLAAALLAVCDPAIHYDLITNSDVRLNRRALSTGGELAYIRNANTSSAYTVTLNAAPALTNAYWLDQSNGKIYKANLVNGSVTATLNPASAIILLCEPADTAMPQSAISYGLPASIEQFSVLNTTALTDEDFTLTVTADNFNTTGTTTAGVVPGAFETHVFTGAVLGNWASNGFQENMLRYVSSPGVFTTKIQIDRLDDYVHNRMILDLGTVCHAVTVIVNDATVGQLYAAPYRIDITGALTEGENEIKIEVQPLKHNRRIGLREAYLADKVVNKRYMFYAGNTSGSIGIAGLTGPVNLLTVKNVGAAVGVTAKARAAFGSKVEYTFKASEMETVNLIELTFAVDGNLLSGTAAAVEALNGFAVFGDIQWKDLGDNQWQGKVILGILENGQTKTGAADVAKLKLDAVKLGDAAVTLTGVRVYGIDIVNGAAVSSERMTAIYPA
ncbi:MAG: hypothetical protein LBH86_02240, partial [Oscillospiraceae bacterium]|nr:hypothetical protein [Oscillospiraceae bacterium]